MTCLPTESSARGRRQRSCSSPVTFGEVRPQDELWVLSTRCLPTLTCGREAIDLTLRVRHFDHEEGWQDATLDDFLAENDMPTWIYVHGNRVEPSELYGRARMVYSRLIAQAPERGSVRYVAWSWPSDQIRGPGKDARSKAWRTETESYYLGWLLSRLDPQTPVGMVGFSFGTRVITGSLQILAGGEISSRALPADAGQGPEHIHVVLLAAAVHNYWLCEGKYHGLAIGRADFVMNLYNCCDRALRFYPHLDKCSRPEALGYTGLACRSGKEPSAEHYYEENVTCYIGCPHSLPNYLCSRHCIALIYAGMTGNSAGDVLDDEPVLAAGP